MKYSEFETIAKENGWELTKGYSNWLYADRLGINVGISKTASKDLNIAIDDVYPILFKDKEFIEACYELAETPIEDREDEKLTAKVVIEKHIELLKKQEESVNLKPYYDLLERVKNE